VSQTAKDVPVNALTIRPDFTDPDLKVNIPYHITDYALVRQLDTVTLKKDAAGNTENHLLIVDQSGVREVDAAFSDKPIFEMRQPEYTKALLRDGYWDTLSQSYGLSTDQQTALNNWRSDARFAPVSVIRIDPGSYSTEDKTKVRYEISQMNPVANPNIKIGSTSQPRINIFEARYGNSDSAGLFDPHDWWIVEHAPALNVNIIPAPWWSQFPDIPGSTYSLTQPFSIDRD
jgi:hypothetical protein